MLKIAHIINPFKADLASDLFTAQPITFETMRRAQQKAADQLDVQLLSAQYPEDRSIVPSFFHCTPDLDRSVLDFATFEIPRKYPILRDILDRMYQYSTAEYLVFTNSDIALQEDFYLRIAAFIEQGYDAFIINRRRISARYTRVEQIPEMWKEKGKTHPGFDCFVFHRDLYPHFRLARVCLGVPFIGITFAQNLFCFAKKFKLFDQAFLTQHIGMEIFKKRAPRPYFYYNRKEFRRAIAELWPQLDSRKFPYADRNLLYRLFTWGLHPSIPIRIALLLEWRQLLGTFKSS